MSAQNSKSVDFGYLNDNKVKKGEKKLLAQTKDWAGGSNREKKDAAREEKVLKAAKKHASSRHQEKVFWKKRAVGIGAVLFLCGIGLFNFLSTVFGFIGGTGVHHISVTDTPKLKSVLFDGDPWLVYCVTNETENQRLPKVLEESTRSLKSNLGLKTAVLHCWDKMESGRTVAQRFKFRSSPPLSFVVANGNKPRVLNLVGITKSEELEKRIKPALKIEVARIDSLKKWPAQCTSRRTCIVVGHRQNAQKDTAMNLLRPLTEKHRATKFVTLDTSFWQLKLEQAVLQTRPGKEGVGADVLCLARDSQEGGGNATYRGTFLQALTNSEASSFVQACESRSGLAPIPKAPRIIARPSKPKKVTAPTRRRRSPAPRPPPRETQRGNVDRVGSRAAMEAQEEEEALFEAVEEGDEDESSGEDGEDDEAEESEEVEL